MLDIKKKFRKLWGGEFTKKDLHYWVAVSSGKPVGEGDVPTLLGRRAGWASRQGASFIEVAVENPSMIISDDEELKNAAAQLGLSYSLHSSTSIGLGSSYIHLGGRGFVPAQDYYRSLIITAGRFKEDLIDHTNGESTLTSINAHASVNTTPPQQERLARDVSVDPYGYETSNIIGEDASKIYQNRDFREQLWIGLIKDLVDRYPREIGLGGFIRNFRSVSEAYHNERADRLKKRKGEFVEQIQDGIEAGDYDGAFDAISRNSPHIAEEIQRNSIKSSSVINAMREKFISSPEAFNNLVGTTRELYGDTLNQEAFVFRQLMPRWMPHAEDPNVRKMWRDITGKTATDPKKAEKELKELRKEHRGQERIISAVTGAYIWGQLTQIEDPAPGVPNMQEGTLVEILDHYDIQITFEAHMAGTIEDLRIWKPRDMITIARAVNNTEVNGETHDVIRATVDMEHLATHRIDPLWVINGNKEQNLKGIEEGDGRMIRCMHVTYPYIAESGAGHKHGPIRRGDKLVFDYIYALVEKGFATNTEENAIIMYEIGSEKAESVYMLRLMLRMIEYDITPQDLKVENIDNLMDRSPDNLKERLLQEFFGLTSQEMQHEWKNIHEHALDPLEGMIEFPQPEYTFEGGAARDRRVAGDDWKREEYR